MNYVRGESNMADSNNSQFLMLNGTYVIYYSLNSIRIHIVFLKKGMLQFKKQKIIEI